MVSFFKNATSNDSLQIARVDGSLLYDASDLSLNIADKASILKNNNNDSLESLNLKASASNVYTKQCINNNDMIYGNALHDKADNYNSYTKPEMKTETQYTFAAPLQRTVDTTTGIFTITIHSNTPINNAFTESIDIQPPAQVGGSIRIIPALNKNEASIGYYNDIDARWTTTGGAWVCGVNCWDREGYSIGTPVLNNGFNIDLNGNVDLPYGLITSAITVDSIRALNLEYLTIDDHVITIGNTSIKRACNIQNNLTVLGNSMFNNITCIKNHQDKMGEIYELNLLWMVENHL